ncbi:MAG: hypothetical protein DIZ80_06555 [endosymbiont of Galathealinum brachiosum]|uniref:Uncharacterized protein n=1 Tax=endosymbiont of Galathealinum brachiosum TaxID=2200906 RepID=A0A370DFU5_9GAMM|nr:MAG: hypothetical protein DIZ80_06555 [endosymbiont of Galathealinum brachiosum]
MIRLCLLLFLFLSTSAYAKGDQEMPAMHHLYKVEPSKEISIPDDFPLNKNKEIDCQTCHGIEDMKQQDFEKIDKKSNDFFREGPYDKITDFCYRCHDTKPYQRDNIHKMLDEENKIIKKTCLYCHEKQLDPEDDLEKSELKLRLEPENICYGCHLDIPHFNALNHQIKPDDEMQKRISDYEKEHKIILPLSEAGKIMCVTCHSPHELDVISQNKPAGKQVVNNDLDKGITYSKHKWNDVFNKDKKDRLNKFNLKSSKAHILNYQRIEKEILLRLPAKDGALCLACHEFEK